MAVPDSYQPQSDRKQSVSSYRSQSDRKQSTSSSRRSSKFGGVFNKVGQYFSEQVEKNAQSELYLAPRDPVVQNYIHHIDEEELHRWLTVVGGKNQPDSLPHEIGSPLSPSNGPTPRSDSMATDYSLSNSRAGSVTNTGTGFPQMTRHQYASDNVLQSYDVFIPDRESQHPSSHDGNNDGYFLIFIHGGYFRDPKQTSTAIHSTISLLESSSSDTTSKITGYASLNYRLSPHPAYPQDPTHTPATHYNSAHWPDQPRDILSALRHIHAHYPSSHRYILSGHSVGATLTFIAALQTSDAGIIPPTHVMGICGIYDFPLIHKTNPDYLGLTANAMGADKFGEASPALYDLERYRARWMEKAKGEGTRRVMLAHSRGDELVNWQQVESMYGVFGGSEKDESEGKDGRDVKCEIVEIQGTHCQVLENGEVARCFREMLGGLVSS